MIVKRSIRIISKYFLYFFLIVLISFFLPRLIPGNPLYALAGEGSGFSTQVPMAAYERFEEYYSPDLPLHQQFTRYLSHLADFDLGYSFYYKTPVIDRILGAAKWTLLLSLSAFLLATVLGTVIGALMGLRNKKGSSALLPVLLSVQSIPTFLLAAVAQIFLAYRLHLFPAIGAVTPGMLPGAPGYLADVFSHMLLPLIVLTVSEIPSISIFAYNSTLRVKRTHFVAFADYLNIEQKQIKLKYIIKNIVPDIIGKLNIQAIMCIMGAMFVEAVFSYPGLGQLLQNATNYRDYPLMQGILLITCLYGIAVNLIFDLILARNVKKS